MRAYNLLVFFLFFSFYSSVCFGNREELPTSGTILSIQPDDMLIGSSTAPNIIIEYSSLSCPHCADFYKSEFQKIKQELLDTQKAVYVHRSFPTTYPSLIAEMLAYCQQRSSGSGSTVFFDTLSILFRTQNQWAFSQNYKDILLDIMQLQGMTKPQFESCIADKEISDKILKIAYEASKVLEVTYSPTMFVNGKMLDGTDSQTIINHLTRR